MFLIWISSKATWVPLVLVPPVPLLYCSLGEISIIYIRLDYILLHQIPKLPAKGYRALYVLVPASLSSLPSHHFLCCTLGSSHTEFVYFFTWPTCSPLQAFVQSVPLSGSPSITSLTRHSDLGYVSVPCPLLAICAYSCHTELKLPVHVSVTRPRLLIVFPTPSSAWHTADTQGMYFEQKNEKQDRWARGHQKPSGSSG